MKGKRIMGGLAITFCVVMLIWFGGWAVWTQFHLWDTMNNVEYGNGLKVVMALAFTMGIGFILKKRKVPVERPDMDKKLEAPAQNPVDLAPVHKRLDEIAEKLADIHMAMTFLKKGKEKDGEKP